MFENLLGRGDALDLCEELPADLRFDLVYLDPPYNAGGELTARTAPGGARGRRRAAPGPLAFEDRFGGTDRFLAMLEPRLAAIRARMREGATLYLHLDHRAVHEAKLACDRIFGRGAFAGEVIWVPGNGARRARGPSVTHQTLLVYARGARDRSRLVWNDDDPLLREPYAETSARMHFRTVDAEGRAFRERTVAGRGYRYYLDAGRRLGSVWTDCPAMAANTPLCAEATGYPTQKPERLLERIVRASSVPGATVADLMCGSGTTLVVAARLGRSFVGGDVGELAIELTRRRLERAGVRYQLFDARKAR